MLLSVLEPIFEKEHKRHLKKINDFVAKIGQEKIQVTEDILKEYMAIKSDWEFILYKARHLSSKQIVGYLSDYLEFILEGEKELIGRFGQGGGDAITACSYCSSPAEKLLLSAYMKNGDRVEPELPQAEHRELLPGNGQEKSNENIRQKKIEEIISLECARLSGELSMLVGSNVRITQLSRITYISVTTLNDYTMKSLCRKKKQQLEMTAQLAKRITDDYGDMLRESFVSEENWRATLKRKFGDKELDDLLTNHKDEISVDGLYSKILVYKFLDRRSSSVNPTELTPGMIKREYTRVEGELKELYGQNVPLQKLQEITGIPKYTIGKKLREFLPSSKKGGSLLVMTQELANHFLEYYKKRLKDSLKPYEKFKQWLQDDRHMTSEDVKNFMRSSKLKIYIKINDIRLYSTLVASRILDSK